MPRTKPITQLGVTGSLEIAQDQAFPSFFESKLQEELYW